jgi:hypothetical protein
MDVFKKLNLKNQSVIAVLNSPPSFEPELAALRDVEIRRDLDRLPKLNFSLAFVTKQKEVDALAKSITKRAEGDAVIWFAYPKGTSKNYKSEINRDSGWRALNAAGFEGMRMVAIDDDWSALRFRRREFVKRADADPKKGRKPLR